MTVGGHPIEDVGSAAFDVADRLAIINLFGAYAYTYDANRLDASRALFTESPELVLLHDGTTLAVDIDTVMSLLAARKQMFAVEHNQRRRPDTTAGCRVNRGQTDVRSGARPREPQGRHRYSGRW